MLSPPTELLAHASSRRDERQPRWTELTLERVFAPSGDDVGYRLTITGRSEVPGEVDLVRTEATPSPSVLVDLLTPRDRTTGRPRLTTAGRRLLLEAGDRDPALREALRAWQREHAER
jgi:hypothetical protein